jgi:hypothetical protein
VVDDHRLLFLRRSAGPRRFVGGLGLGGRGGALELGASGARHAEEGSGGVAVLGDVADVAGGGSGADRRGGGGLGLVRGRDPDDGDALEHGLDGVLARLPLAGPEQADGAVDGVDDAAAGLVEQGAEDGGAEGVGARARGGGEEVEQPRTAVELGEEDGGVGLRLGGLDPLQARADGAGVAAALAQHPATVAAHPHLAYYSAKKRLVVGVRWFEERRAARGDLTGPAAMVNDGERRVVWFYKDGPVGGTSCGRSIQSSKAGRGNRGRVGSSRFCGNRTATAPVFGASCGREPIPWAGLGFALLVW